MTTAADKAERLRVARFLLQQGYGYMEVVRLLQDKYAVVEKTAKNYVQEARLTYIQTQEHLCHDAYLDYGRSEPLLQMAIEEKDVSKADQILERRQRLRKEIQRNGLTQSRFSAEQGLSNTLASAVAEIIKDQSE